MTEFYMLELNCLYANIFSWRTVRDLQPQIQGLQLLVQDLQLQGLQLLLQLKSPPLLQNLQQQLKSQLPALVQPPPDDQIQLDSSEILLHIPILFNSIFISTGLGDLILQNLQQ